MTQITVGGFFAKAKTLAQAIAQSSDGDTIIIRSRNIAITEPLLIKHTLYIEGADNVIPRIDIRPHVGGITSLAPVYFKDVSFMCANQSRAITAFAFLSLDNVTFDHLKKIIDRENYTSLSVISVQERPRVIIKNNTSIDSYNITASELEATDSNLAAPINSINKMVCKKDIVIIDSTIANVNVVSDTSVKMVSQKGDSCIMPGVAIRAPKVTIKDTVFDVFPDGAQVRPNLMINDTEDAQLDNISLRNTKMSLFRIKNSHATISNSVYEPQYYTSKAINSNVAFKNTNDTTKWELIQSTTSAVRQGDDASQAVTQLDALIGLGSVKSRIHAILNTVKMNAERAANGIASSTQVAMHMSFEGNAGTGKTTVAKLVGQALYENGVLPTNKFVIAKRADLIGQHVGETAIKATKKIEEAIGGVLFLDEAYELAVRPNSNGFESEAITALVDIMEQQRGNMVVIVAGYTEDMKRFFASNQGLPSRFTNRIVFPDYSLNELIRIFVEIVASNQQKLAERDVADLIVDVIKYAINNNVASGNGRFVRNMYEGIVSCRDDRIAQLPKREPSDYINIGYDDVLEYVATRLKPEVDRRQQT